MKFTSIIFLVALQIFTAKKCFRGGCGCNLPLFLYPNQNNIANINNCANSNASALAVQAGFCGDANACANSAATNANCVHQGTYF